LKVRRAVRETQHAPPRLAAFDIEKHAAAQLADAPPEIPPGTPDRSSEYSSRRKERGCAPVRAHVSSAPQKTKRKVDGSQRQTQGDRTERLPEAKGGGADEKNERRSSFSVEQVLKVARELPYTGPAPATRQSLPPWGPTNIVAGDPSRRRGGGLGFRVERARIADFALLDEVQGVLFVRSYRSARRQSFCFIS